MIERLTLWLDRRVGYRRLRDAVLNEHLPPGTGWAFTLGAVLLALIAVQISTGAFLTLYYAPTPDHAYDSVRFINATTSGRVVRGLHYFGASFLIVFITLHAIRVIAFGSYKAPREITWLSGLALLGLLLAFALTGYLLPWDQRAYWATVVTINISRLAPVGGDALAALLQGGPTIGALTLIRWYSVHVVFLPALLVALVTAHVVLMRRHGISGPVHPGAGEAAPFYPWHAARDAAAIAIVLAALGALAWRGAPALEAPADPADASYVPRPEWYFLSLFQLLKYFPGPLEAVGAVVLPGLVALALVLLPWLDRAPERNPLRRPWMMSAVGAGLIALTGLTALGWRDRPARALPREEWSLREIGGRAFAETAGCGRCHGDAGVADPLERAGGTRGAEWIAGHITDPDMISPGLRDAPSTMHEREAAAILAYVRRQSREPFPDYTATVQTAAAVFARHCIGCHSIDGDGGADGPDLSSIGRTHGRSALRRWIADPESVDPDAEMPAFAKRLSPSELEAIAEYLAERK